MRGLAASIHPQTDRLILWPLGYAAVAAAALAIMAAPLAAYVLLIALFGLPHVLCELRYCDERFSGRSGRGFLIALFGLIALLVLVRLAQGASLLPTMTTVHAELLLGAALAGVAVLVMRKRRLIGAGLGLAIAAGAALAPVPTFLATAWLHNLTPLAFAAEILPKDDRARTLLRLAVPFLLLPAVIATGWPQQLLAPAQLSIFGAGASPLSAFLPRTLPFAQSLPLFSAAVTAQAMHYFAVIVVLPRLLAAHGGGAPLLDWPSWPRFYGLLALAALLVFAAYGADYAQARSAYGIAAALHSWIELPIFLIALGGGFRRFSAAP